MAQEIRKATAQQIVDSIKDVCSHDINYINSRGIIFASTDEGRIGGFHEIGMQVVRTGQTTEVETDNSFFGTHKGVNIPIEYNHQVIAAVGISGVPGEVRKYAELARKVTFLILREQELEARNYNWRTQISYLVQALATHSPIQHSYVSDVLRKYQIPEDGAFCTVVVETAGTSARPDDPEVEQQIFQVFQQTGAHLYCFQYPNEYLLILEQQRLKRWLYLFRRLAEEHSGSLKIGIGTARTLMEQNRSYTAARIALKSLFGGQSLAVFEELDLEIVLGAVPKTTQDFFTEKVLQHLTERDCLLLQSYYACGMSLKKTCEALYLHKNTLQYQLDRIRHSSGYDPRSFQDAVVLYTALKLQSLR